jgi:AcrR family transcriptional regulator
METQIRKDAKRKHIMDTAARVFAERGYHGTTVKDIVDEAEISVGSFYFYFKGKENLFAELYTEITREFDEKTLMVLDTKNFSLVKNYTRAITVNLWMYQQRRELTRIMLVEAAGLNPEFNKRRWESVKQSWKSMEERFHMFIDRCKSPVNIPDARVASLAFNGSLYYLVLDWAEGKQETDLTDSAFALSVYNLQAIKVSFDEEEIKQYVKELLDELMSSPETM